LFLLLASLIIVLASGQGGLRSALETTLADGDDPLQLLHDSESIHRHGLNTNLHHNHEKRHAPTHSRNLTGTHTCGNSICSSVESVSDCPADCGNLELVASDIGQYGSMGVMFYVEAKRDLSISSFDFLSGSRAAEQPVQVYTRSGKYSGFELNEDGWEIVYDDDSVNLLGGNKPTPVDLDLRVTIPAETFQSFFIWTPNNRIRYALGTAEGAVYSSNDMLMLYEGLGTSRKFSGSYDESISSPRVFRGAIRYDVVSLNQQGGDPLSSGLPFQTRVSCLNNQRRVRIEIKTDKYGYETSWLFRMKGGEDPVVQGPDGRNYESSTLYDGTICVDIGMYEFEIEDAFKDGICCSAGEGHYSIDVQNEDGSWRDAVRGSKFASSVKHIIDVGLTESTMTDRDKAYLVAHNKRRIEWHARYSKEYVALKWSKGLKESSMEYAVALLDTCTSELPEHDPNSPWGENLARNQGSGGWGQLYDPDKILNRFVEREEGLPWARNGHLTNALWRATHYVGCAEAEKSYNVTNANGSEQPNNCRVQVCRYAKPGNCGMGAYKDDNGIHDWERAMLMDDSPCGPDCPPEGCSD